jgi:mRNA interferase RelE/StbE
MVYNLILTDRARASLKSMSPDVARRVVRKIERMRNGLAGDVKRLTNFEPAYRLRVGDWRVLFDLTGASIVVQDVKHRSEVYDS